MKKRVNGKTVDIGNIEVFEKAAESMAINRTVMSAITDKIGVGSDIIDEYIYLYGMFYKSLPFPLYAIDNDAKYAVIGCFIKKRATNIPKLWVNNGLYICIDEDNKIVLNFINSSWGLIKVESIKEDNTDLTQYQSECGFNDLLWALSKILNKESTSGYYKEFMPEFIKACNNQPMVLKWELSNILDFGRIPNRYSFESNKILDMETKNEYILDIFVAGVRESKEKQHVWSLFGDEEDTVKPKLIKMYGFEVYRKVASGEDRIKPNEDKLHKCELFGATSIFNTLCAIKNINDSNVFEPYVAFIAGENLVYSINNRVFIAKANRFAESKEIARGVELYAYDREMIFLVKSKNLGKGIKKETIYSYSLKDGNLRLCKIQFKNT